MNVFLCGFGLAGHGVVQYLLDRSTRLAIFSHPSMLHANRTICAGAWSTTESVNDPSIWPFQPDIICSVYYRHIIKPWVIEAVNGRIFNTHPSLLPKHRGCSSVPWAIIEGDKETGLTFHYIDSGIDTGKIILQISTPIQNFDTQETLQYRLAKIAVDYFPAAFELCWTGFEGITQSEQGEYHSRECPYNGEIDLSWSPDKIERFIRAMIYPPLPKAKFRGREITHFDEIAQYMEPQL